jgi:hypothetical protein
MLQFMMKHGEGINHGTAGALCTPFRVFSLLGITSMDTVL